MIGIPHSWYGAGSIDWMARGADGNLYRLNGIPNVNTEAFMRSNLSQR